MPNLDSRQTAVKEQIEDRYDLDKLIQQDRTRRLLREQAEFYAAMHLSHVELAEAIIKTNKEIEEQKPYYQRYCLAHLKGRNRDIRTVYSFSRFPGSKPEVPTAKCTCGYVLRW